MEAWKLAFFGLVWSVSLGIAGPAPEPFTVKEFAGIKFVWIPGGKFTMGTLGPVRERLEAEGVWSRFLECELPAREVWITKGFWVGRFEITQEQWRSVLGDKPNSDPSTFKGKQRPVENVSWEDIQLFLEELNQSRGGGFRLPTESEWEYISRAGSRSEFGIGEGGVPIELRDLEKYAWFKKNADGESRTVGSLKPNAWGIYDLHGNVWEWCADFYDAKAYYWSDPYDPVNHQTSPERVMRGGSWYLSAMNLRSGQRSGNWSDFRSPYVGFRLVRQLDGE
jgi:formylglycine-generating enzyme required for sulfatase activity